MLSSLARHAKRHMGMVWAWGLAAGLAVTMAAIGPADAHGEKSQAAFLRMRTLNWYDLKWSKTKVAVNEEYEITGKLYIMNAWPSAIEPPNQCFLNLGQPGAMAARLGVWVGGQFTPRSMKLEIGKTYAFRQLLKARRPGHWHTHVQLNVKIGGPIPGPGQYIDITGNFSDYKDEVKLLNGTTVDIETYGEPSIILWHLVWIIAGGAWILYWFNKRGFIGRFAWVASGKAEEIITNQERVVGALTLVAVLLVVIIFYAITVSNYPNTIPLQAGDFHNIEAIENGVNSGPVTIKFVSGSYKVPGRELVANIKVTNSGKEPLRIGEFNTAGLRFLNPDVYTAKVEYPDYLLADRGLSVNYGLPGGPTIGPPRPKPQYPPSDSSIQPGETREVTLTIQDARWDTERLSGLAYDVDSSFAGVLFLFSPSGARYPVELSGAVIPTFLPV